MDSDIEYNIKREREEIDLQKKKLDEFNQFINKNKPSKEELKENENYSKKLGEIELESQKAHEKWLQSMQTIGSTSRRNKKHKFNSIR